jgi:hypothetical protein
VLCVLLRAYQIKRLCVKSSAVQGAATRSHQCPHAEQIGAVPVSEAILLQRIETFRPNHRSGDAAVVFQISANKHGPARDHNGGRDSI